MNSLATPLISRRELSVVILMISEARSRLRDCPNDATHLNGALQISCLDTLNHLILLRIKERELYVIVRIVDEG